MDWLRELLTRLPTPAQVQADAERNYPGNEMAQTCYQAGTLMAYYFTARTALESVLPPEPDEDNEPGPDIGDPVGVSVEAAA